VTVVVVVSKKRSSFAILVWPQEYEHIHTIGNIADYSKNET